MVREGTASTRADEFFRLIEFAAVEPAVLVAISRVEGADEPRKCVGFGRIDVAVVIGVKLLEG